MAIGIVQDGGDANDQIDGSADDDTLSGGGGHDTLVGGAGDDSLTGGSGNDVFCLDFHEATGTDRISDFAPGQDTLRLLANTITSVVAYDYAAVLPAGCLMVSTGSARTILYLRGEAGVVQTVVLQGVFTASQFMLSVGAWGTDVTIRQPSTDGADSLAGSPGHDFIEGLGGDDFIDGGAGSDTLSGGAGNDSIVGGGPSSGGADLIAGGAGRDTVSYDYSQSTSGIVFHTTVAYGSQQDLADGSTDLLTGIEQVDVTGGAGDDVIRGDFLDSHVRGGGGNDTLTGGAGNDAFAYDVAAPNGQDRITDLGTGDLLRFGGVELAGPILHGDDPSGLEPGQVMLGTPAGGVTLLYVQMGGAAGLTTIELAGAFTRGNFSIHYDGTGTSLNVLQPGAGNDTFAGGTGHEYLEGLGGNDVLGGADGNDTLLGGDGHDHHDGGAGDDLLAGGAGSDSFETGDGNDTVDGGAITDRIHYTDLNSISYADAAGAISLNLQTGEVAKASGIDHLANINFVTASAYDDALVGSDDAALLEQFEGGMGNDTIDGAGGWDEVAYTTSAAGVNVSLAAGKAFDDGFGHVDDLAGIEAVRGSGFRDTLTGDGGANVLDGQAGADTMDGGAGDDTYVVDAAGDLVIETAEGGVDSVHARVSSVLATFVEHLTLTGSAPINGTGNDAANSITGNAGANVLDGKAGADTMAGGGGKDSYRVDTAGDVIIETSTGGVDSVTASLSYVLGSFVENLRLSGVDAIDGTGNQLANSLAGNAGANVLDGMGGIDTMAGGAGDDTYIADHGEDDIVESAGGGVDRAIASASYGLADFVENLKLTGTALHGTGNALANVLTGHAGSNLLDGRAGADTLIGGAGNDTYIVDDVGDRVVETATGGMDLVDSTVSYILPEFVEGLVLSGTAALHGRGNALDNRIYGNAGGNLLDGGAGADVLMAGGSADRLVGGAGADRLIGGGGADKFIFADVLDSTAAAPDRISDFRRGTDRIDLSDVDADTTLSGQQHFTFIGAAAFGSDATGQLRFEVIDSRLVLLGSTDADSMAEFTVEMIGVGALDAGDLWL